jgi:hypothetical protein
MQQTRMQLEQAQRQQGIQDQLRQAAGQAFAPPQEAHGPMESGQGAPMLPGGGGMPDFAQRAMAIDPMVGMQYLPKPREPKFHNVNGHLVQEPTEPGGQARSVFQAQREQWRELGRDPMTKQIIMESTLTGERKAVGSMPSQVNVGAPKLESEEQKGMGQLHIKDYGDIKTSAGVARKENSLLTALAKNPIQTNAAMPLTATAAAWLSAAGLGGDQVKDIATNAQKFNAVAKDLVLQKQLAQKGPQTESDARRLEQTVANLGNTPESNAAIIAFSMAQNNRTIQQEQFYSRWWQQKGTMRGADDAWINGPGGKSLWDDPSLARFAGAAPAQAGAQTGMPSIEEVEAEIRRRQQGQR